MTLQRITSLLLILFLTTSCHHRDDFTIEDAVKSSKVIIHHYQNNSMNMFRTWHYRWRGANIWDKGNKDSIFYRVFSFPESSQDHIRVDGNFSFSFFLTDFPISVKIDTCGLQQIEFQKLNNKEMQITTEYYIRSSHSKRLIKTTQHVFRKNNLFSYFNNLLVETPKYRITEIYYRSWSDCYNFQIAPNYFLRYVPDSSILKTSLPRKLRMDLVNTYRLNRNWYLGPWQ